jgi:ribonuclease BN (tRNA processing enzyme)
VSPGLCPSPRPRPEPESGAASAAGTRRLLLTHLRPSTDRNEALQLARATFSGDVGVAIAG